MPSLTSLPHGDLYFEKLIAAYMAVPRFVERGWLWDQIERAMDQPKARYILLCGEPGSGKSSFMAWIAAQHPEWPRYFIRRDQRAPLGDVGIRSFLLQVGFQLAARFPELFDKEQVRITVRSRVETLEPGAESYGAVIESIFASPFYRAVVDVSHQVQVSRGRSAALKIDEWVTDPRLVPQEDLAYMALIDPVCTFARQHPGRRLLILVDALDELRYRPAQGVNLLDWLTDCPELPDPVFFLLASREDRDLLAGLRSRREAALVEIPLDKTSVEMRRDVLRYGVRLVREPHVRQVLGPGRRKPFLLTVAEKARGNLGYMDALGRAVDHARHDPGRLADLLDLASLPASLSGLYAHFLELVRRSVEGERIPVEDARRGESGYLRAWPALYKKVFSVLTVAMEPLRAEQIAALGHIPADRDTCVDALARLGQFLEWEGTRARLYHATLAEFLCDPATESSQATTLFYVDAPGWHRRIADYYRGRFERDWGDSDDYGLEYTLHHLQQAGLSWDELDQALRGLLSEAFIRERGGRAGWHRPLVRDLYQIQKHHPLLVVDPCVEVMGGSHRNSLVNQEILRLLAGLHPSPLEYGLPTSLSAPRGGSKEDHIRTVLQALTHPPERAVRVLLALLKEVADVQMKGVVALALGETGGQRDPPHPATPPLFDILLKATKYVRDGRDAGHLRWCAADGLIALRDPACVKPLVKGFWQAGTSPWLKQQIIYALGRMEADLEVEEKRRLIDHGLSLRQDCVPRFVDAIYLLEPEKGAQRGVWRRHYEGLLGQGLGFLPVQGDPVRKVWTTELTRKRALTTLGRVGSPASRDHLEGLVREYDARQSPLSDFEATLLRTARRALHELQED
jgi:hypothetical protein